MVRDWNIQPPARVCAGTGRDFVPDEVIFSALLETPEGLQRQDFSAEAWQLRNENLRPVSHWKSVVKPQTGPREAMTKDDAQSLLRRLIEGNQPESRNAIYILALMLERKRLFKPVDRITRDGERWVVYEESATGDTFLIPQCELRLDQLEAVQAEVSALLAPPGA